MRSSWRIGSIGKIPFYINPSWLIILLLVTATNAAEIQARSLTDEHLSWLGWVIGLLMALLLFGSVLLHELGHSLSARSQGIKVNSITLFLFGGLASIERESDTPLEALKIAVAGPAVSLVLFASFSLLELGLEKFPLPHYVVMDVARVNFILAIFNLIPGLPLDGGQILKSIIWQVTGDRLKALRQAARSGQILGYIAIGFGLFLLFLTGDFSACWIALLGWFVLKNASVYSRMGLLQEALLHLTAADAMDRDLKIVNAGQSLQEFTREYILNPRSSAYYAVSEGRYRGLVRVSDLQSIDRDLWNEKTLLDIAHPLDMIASVLEKAPLFQVVQILETITDSKLTVLSPAGAVAGVIDKSDVVRAIAAKYDSGLTDADIEQVKSSGKYPPFLPLNTVANTLNGFSEKV